jgi:hypothetical protein
VPSTSPTQPPAARSPLGRPDQAILVRPIGASWTTPDSLEVTLYDPTDQTSKVIATIPGNVIPAGKWIATDAMPVVSGTGWLAIPYRPGPNAQDPEPGVVFVDLLHPTAPPNSVAGISSGSWSADDTFAALTDGGVQLYYPATNDLGTSQIKDPAVQIKTIKDGAYDPVWTTAPNSRFVGLRDTGEWGVISVDGSFSATSDLPPVYQRTGLERLAGVDAHTFQPACTGGGTTLEAGCSMVEADATGQAIATRVNTPDYAYLADFAWATDGRDAWLLFDDGKEGGSGASGDGVASLSLSRPDGSREEYSRLQLGDGGHFAILGVSQSAEGLPIVAIGSRNSWLRAFVAADGSPAPAGSHGYSTVLDPTTWFAGWAGQQPDYDPD